jgi:hypothetical protein
MALMVMGRRMKAIGVPALMCAILLIPKCCLDEVAQVTEEHAQRASNFAKCLDEAPGNFHTHVISKLPSA